MARIFTDADFVNEEQAPQTGRVFSDADFADSVELPRYANGLSPETAINQSPISVEDRAKLSVGNEAGKIKYLQERFGEVTKLKTGDLAVKNNGFWQRVDPKGLGDGDAWSMTKELLADAVDIAPEAVKIGAQVGASATAALASGGTSLLAQAPLAAGVGAALEAGETSLGRLFGTYEATPEEQLRDIAVEGMLNLGGTVVAAGVKPTLGLVAEGLKKSANVIKNVAPIGSKDSLKSFFGGISGVGAKNFDTLIDNADQVTGYMKQYEKLASSADDVVSKITKDNIDSIERIALNVRPTLSSMYDDMAKEVVENVPPSFKSNIGTAVSSAQKALADMGIGEIDQAGKFIPFSEERLIQLAKETGEVNPLLNDAASRKILADMTNEMSKYTNIKELSGKAGADQLMKFRKTFTDFTYRLKEEADEAALIPAQRAIAAVKSATDNSTVGLFQLPAPIKSNVTGELTDNLLINMNKQYEQVVNEVQPLLKAVGASKKQGGQMPFQTLYSQLNALSGRNEVQKSGFEKALDLMGKFGGPAGKASNELYKEVQLREAAAAFTPFAKKGLISQGGVGFGVGSLIAGNLPGVAAAAGSVAATSPRLQYNAIKAAMAGNKLLSTLNPPQVGQLLSNPQALNSFFQTIVQTPQIQEQVKTDMIRQGTGGAF